MMHAERMKARGLDVALVTNWEGRPKRARKPPPMTYWDEYVATDPWYLRELVSDVPADELDAAILHEDWSKDEAVDSDDEIQNNESTADDESEDPDYSDVASSDDNGDDFEDAGSNESVESELDSNGESSTCSTCSDSAECE